ncbi:hypothetical protein PCANC_01469 [Puccinia coronata f. sp. avenae]|uniref:Homeobox domain-containing protein n=1 Tax=Puccinia coronata f. sp. avenae TaxID=200324 RepID=A0A2N5W2U8_9BASI|nr:hypothetical protein PCANC_01469 [Puccinia coronata f. sp. avenae]
MFVLLAHNQAVVLASSILSTKDVKPEQGLSEPTLIEQPDQHPTPAPPRRTSYSLYYHNTNEPEVYPEFNWPEHSSAQLSNMGDPALSENDAAENKADNSPLALVLEPYQGTASPSPPSSRSETFISDVGTASGEVGFGRQAPQHDGQVEEILRVSNKRPRAPSLLQLDNRCFQRYCRPHVTSPHSSPGSVGSTAAKLKENVDSSGLPPIVTREEVDRGSAVDDTTTELQVPATREYDKRVSVAVDALGDSSPSRADSNSTSLKLPSELASFPAEDCSHQNSTHQTPATPHSATSVSFSSHQPQSQQLHFPSHSNGYLSALPSPVVPHCDGNSQPADRGSYPSSPGMTLTAPNSATFPQEPNSSFGPLTSQLQSTGTPSHHLVSPSSTSFRSSDAAFSQPAQSRLIRPAYPSSGKSHDLDTPSAPATAVPATRLTTSPVPPLNQASSWSSVENQAPRRRGKLPSAVTTILKGWLMAHTTHPYPTEEEKKKLCQETNLTMNQVSNWFINARRRILVPPSAGNSVHEVRQPIRRQAQSQLVRAAGHAGAVPPCLTIRHVGSQSHSASTSPGLSMFSPISVGSPHLSGAAGSFDFRYPMSHQSVHESPYHAEGLSTCPSTSTLSPCSNQWPNSAQLLRQPPSSPMYASHGNQGAVPYYPSAQSFQGYPPNHSSSSTPIPSPHFTSSFPSGPHYPTPQARLHSPRPNADSHPPTPTLSHSSGQHHSVPAYLSHAPGNPSVSFPTNQDADK